MMYDTLISPKVDHAIRRKVINYKRKDQSPNFRDILRQRCRERVKANRGALFDRLRNIDSEESMRNTLSQYIDSDLKDLNSFCSLQNMDLNEEMDVEDQPLSCMAETEKEKWILEEYERLIVNTQAELAERVACPMCSRGLLQQNCGTSSVTCSLCTLLLPLTVPLAELERLIMLAVDCHGVSCGQQPTFTVCPDLHSPSLLLMCMDCNYCHQVV